MQTIYLIDNEEMCYREAMSAIILFYVYGRREQSPMLFKQHRTLFVQHRMLFLQILY